MAIKMDFLNKTKEPTEMERVDANIAQVQAEIQQRLLQLGQMYYEEHKNDENTGDKQWIIVDTISKLEHNRIGFQKNKLRLQGQMMCENCGAIIPYGSIFCNACGKKADEKQEGGEASVPGGVEAPAGRRCAVCGAAMEEDSVFCTSCGAKAE